MHSSSFSVRVPPATDVEGLLNNYGNLFEARGIQHPIPFSNPTPTCHAIPESAKILLDDFMSTSEMLKGLTLRYDYIKVDDVKILPTQMLFSLELGEEFGTVISLSGKGL